MSEPSKSYHQHWMLIGWGTVGGARLTHAWRYDSHHQLLQSVCQSVLRYGLALELLHPATEHRCKVCQKRGA